MKAIADDFEHRLAAFHGGKPLPRKVALGGMRDVEYALRERFNEGVSRQAEAAECFKDIQAPILDLIANDKRVIRGLRNFDKMNARLGKRRIAPPPHSSPRVAPRITSGSILSVASTPYDYPWAWSAIGGSGSAHAEAHHADGTALVYVSGNRGGSAIAAAGIGKYFRPISENAFVRFSPYVRYSYFWYDNSTYVTAHNDGFVGVLIWSYDLNGGDPRKEIDIRPSLWSDGTSWFQVHTDEQDGVVWAYSDTVYMPATSNRQYVVWVWCNTSCDDGNNDLGSSYAAANLGIRIPFMVFEQWT